MKRIINGKRYDTDTAEEIATNGYSHPGDFDHFTETLYRTRNGNWFIAGAGGPRSKYSEQTGQNQWSGGEGLQPLSEAKAKEWLERYQETTALETYFKEQIEDA